MFLTPEDRDRLLNPAVINRFISAELPTPETDPDGHLTAVIELMMIHGPCGVDNPSALCMVSPGPGQPKVYLKGYL